jgi:hypothetical protein
MMKFHVDADSGPFQHIKAPCSDGQLHVTWTCHVTNTFPKRLKQSGVYQHFSPKMHVMEVTVTGRRE